MRGRVVRRLEEWGGRVSEVKAVGRKVEVGRGKEGKRRRTVVRGDYLSCILVKTCIPFFPSFADEADGVGCKRNSTTALGSAIRFANLDIRSNVWVSLVVTSKGVRRRKSCFFGFGWPCRGGDGEGRVSSKSCV